MITMKEIAEIAGVSQATVSRVLSGSSAVSPRARQTVMEIVQKHDYTPNYSARNLAMDQSFLIGLIIPDISNPFFGEIVRQVEREAGRNGYNIIICNSDGDITKERSQLQTLRARQVDGVLVIPASSNSPILTTLYNSDIHTVVVTQPHSRFDSVYVSHLEGGRIVAQHLLGLGHTRVLLVGDSESENDKIVGFKQVFSEKGIIFPEDHFLNIGAWDHDLVKQAYLSGLEYFRRHRPGHATAVFTVNDVAAFGINHALKELNLRIPDDVALIGFDDTFLSQGLNPPLSSVSQPVEEIGRRSIEMLLDRLIRKFDGDVRSVQLNPLLVARESTLGRQAGHA
ncbi:MAG: LacI family transcriptional regulator [Spirochaetia bacterium]|nr:LacI family transcriptional regulator [Spirochaetia bacterium]